MIVAAYCPACDEPRAQTADLPPGSRPRAADFVPIAGQEQPVDGTPAVCTHCKAGLVFRRMPVPGTNGHVSEAPPRQPVKGISTLFELGHGEEIRDSRQLSTDVFIIFTNRRIVKIDLTALVEES